MAENMNSDTEEEVKILELDLNDLNREAIEISTDKACKVVIKIPEFTVSD